TMQARCGTLPTTQTLPEALQHSIQNPQPDEDSSGTIQNLLATLVASVTFVANQWSANQLNGFHLVESELLLARGAAGSPVAMQGRLGDSYLVAVSVSGNPAEGGAALDMQC